MNVNAIYLKDVLNKLIKIDNTYYPNLRKKDGDIGERFVKDSIKYYMWEKGFKLRKSGNSSFKIKGQYKSGKGGMGGIDFWFVFVHNNKQYDCYVEVKNWNIFVLTPTMFQEEVLNRFLMNVNQPGNIKILTVNRGYLRPMGALCLNHNIHIVPIDTKITKNQLNATSLRSIMENFLDEFDKLITTLTTVKLRKSLTKMPLNSKPYDEVIILGLEPVLIANMFGTTPGNIQKRKSQLKKWGFSVLDSRSKTSIDAKFITKDQEYESYLYIMREMIERKIKKDI